MSSAILAAAPEAAARAAVHADARVRVAFVHNLMDVGGTEINALKTAQRLDRSRFDLVVVTFAAEGPLYERYAAAGVRVVRIGLTTLTGASTLAEGRRLYRFLRDERIDVVHAHDLYSNVFAVPVARLARVPLVIASRRFTHDAYAPKLLAANRLAYRLAHRALGNSSAVARVLRERDGVPASRVLEVSNFVEDHAFRPLAPSVASAFRAECGIPADAMVVGCIARLDPVKDHASLVRAVALLAPRLPALHLCIVGDGPTRAPLEALVAELGVADRVHFAGYRPNTPNLHHAFDVSALASLSEGFPNSLVEAMAAGRPVVATDVGGNPDAVRAGTTGLLVPPAAPDRLADAMARLVGDAALRESMGREAMRVAHEEYRGDVVVPGLESTYLRLLGR